MTKIEQVARAIEPDAWSPLVWHIWPPRRFNQWKARRKARAAIEAMREPTDDMAFAVHFQFCSRFGLQFDGNAGREVWIAMVDAALAETPA